MAEVTTPEGGGPDLDRAKWFSFIAGWIGLMTGLVRSPAEHATLDMALDGIGYAIAFSVLTFAVIAGVTLAVHAWRSRE